MDFSDIKVEPNKPHIAIEIEGRRYKAVAWERDKSVPKDTPCMHCAFVSPWYSAKYRCGNLCKIICISETFTEKPFYFEKEL